MSIVKCLLPNELFSQIILLEENKTDEIINLNEEEKEIIDLISLPIYSQSEINLSEKEILNYKIFPELLKNLKIFYPI